MSDREGSVAISLGDALRAHAALGPRDARAKHEIAALLGLVDAPTAPSIRPSGPWQDLPRDLSGMDELPDVAKKVPPRTNRVPVPSPDAAKRAMSVPELIGRIPFDVPPWTNDDDVLVNPTHGSEASLAPPPLIGSRVERAILSAALATGADGPEIDVDRVTLALSEGRRLVSIPYREIRTLRRGAQILVDTSRAMDPLRHDVDRTVDGIARLFGAAHVDVLSFAHCPVRRGDGSREVWTSPRDESATVWRAPTPGTPVLIVSDFALAPAIDEWNTTSVSDWIDFASEIASAGCAPVGLIPYPPSRWPTALIDVMTFIHWSERTTARQVAQALRVVTRRRQ